ncbi:MAG: hypothetical protein LBS69_09385 [Prevotellaceae bacterium]|jgi:hypothetical protein|nr:hypothetical protein [Prevotellaceae bacterium]
MKKISGLTPLNSAAVGYTEPCGFRLLPASQFAMTNTRRQSVIARNEMTKQSREINNQKIFWIASGCALAMTNKKQNLTGFGNLSGLRLLVINFCI